MLHLYFSFKKVRYKLHKQVFLCPCRFHELSSILEPGRPARTDKVAILDDAVRVLTQLGTEAQELKETNEKLLEEIKTLKVRPLI